MSQSGTDIYRFYEQATQSPDADVRFISGIFARRRGRPVRSLREDFCGSAALSRAFVRSGRLRTAVAIDIDTRLIERAQEFAKRELASSTLQRLELKVADVLKAGRGRGRFDVIAAYNFSYFTFKRRRELLTYFRRVHQALAPGGLFFGDIFGGMTAEQPSIEVRELKGFDYIWEQADFDPISRTLEAYIHFRLHDGPLIRRAFRYDWRLWQPIELQELLEEAGFASSSIYWEDRDDEGAATHRFRRRTRAAPEPSWTAYVVAEK
jgi:SAM-dependent methyltransferase